MVVIVDYKMGNIGSVAKAFSHFVPDVKVSCLPEDIRQASHIVLPGVGAFGQGMENLRKLGLVELLEKKVRQEKTPFLGICLGMQLLASAGREFGEHKGLGWIKGEAIKLEAPNLRLPHVGWNNIEPVKESILFNGLPDNNFYFVHSYHLRCEDSSVVSSVCDYGQKFAASVEDGNIFGVQFHPEKSQVSGLHIIKQFLSLA